MKISSHFVIQEFVPSVIWKKFGTNSIWFISPFMINYAELVRTRFGKPTFINTWHSGGILENRGFRIPTAPYDSLSQHKYKCAIDLNVSGHTPEEVCKDIVDNFDIYRKVGVTTMEDIRITTGKIVDDFSGWTHADCRTTNKDELLIIKPIS